MKFAVWIRNIIELSQVWLKNKRRSQSSVSVSHLLVSALKKGTQRVPLPQDPGHWLGAFTSLATIGLFKVNSMAR